MNKLQEVLEDYNNWVRLELEQSKLLEGSYLKAFKSLLGIDWELREIFFNKTSLVVIDIDDYQGLKELCPDLKDAFKMECEQFNINIYVLSFVSHKKLNVLLGGAS